MNKLFIGDYTKLLERLADKSVHSVVTSPPYYKQRKYNDSSDVPLGRDETQAQYINRLNKGFQGLYRVLRDDGTLWLNIGDSYARKNLTGGYDERGKINRKGMMSTPWRLSLSMQGFCSVPFESLDYWSDTLEAAINQNDMELVKLVKQGIDKYRIAKEVEGDWILRSAIIWAKPDPFPGSYKDRPTSSYEFIFMFSKSSKYFYNAQAIGTEAKPETIRRAKRGNWAYGGQKHDGYEHNGYSGKEGKIPDYVNRRDVWKIPTANFKGPHYAVFPDELAELCILAGTPEFTCGKCATPYTIDKREPQCFCGSPESTPGVVLDPFMGSGTVAKVAVLNRRNWVGFDIDPRSREYTKGKLRGLNLRLL